MLTAGLLFLLVGLSLAADPAPGLSCSSNSTACGTGEDNLLSFTGGVTSLTQCRQLCHADPECAYFTYFGLESFPMQEVCFLFSSCGTAVPCESCVTETRDCYRACSSAYTGALDDNIVNIMPDVSSDVECRLQCQDTQDCSFYTHFSAADPMFPRLCMLLSHLKAPLQPCDSCSSGPADCSDSCVLMHEGVSHMALMVTNTREATEVSLVQAGDTGNQCHLRSLLLGGGGYGRRRESQAGAGSGFLHYLSHNSWGGAELRVEVGEAGEASTLSISGDTFAGLPGQDAYKKELGFSTGGDGYSGGGDFGRCSGGTDGSDGWGSGDEGEGQGIKIEELLKTGVWKLTRWSLTPGAAGEYSMYHDNLSNNNLGGGGGGILVDGQGPERAAMTQGEGFGGGGAPVDENCGDCSSAQEWGLQGVVLLEVGP